MKLALDALNGAWGYGTQRLDDKLTKAIKALEEAIANHIPDDTKMVSGVKDSLTTQQEQGEPVAWLFQDRTWTNIKAMADDHPPTVPVYTTPQQRKPLTDEQMRDCLDAADQMYCERDGDKELFKARAIEAAHGITKETP